MPTGTCSPPPAEQLGVVRGEGSRRGGVSSCARLPSRKLLHDGRYGKESDAVGRLQAPMPKWKAGAFSLCSGGTWWLAVDRLADATRWCRSGARGGRE
eukprot:CAMPEP_0119473100 /NCGR_PEP_ID=MMETSP1344-20130328/4890_1 /TAXON_ID=236787 /ORGANISM="Florenciella parvula, Strain CCMP2471" /LENGTH=97 /DNA_ID=CAMNT_0007506153 /DNA_START=83 /DNA_END=372 /DNA_ORIENTATION=-